MRSRYDAIVIGSGHNGLVCANYLAAAGWKVLVVERRGVIGGAVCTEEMFGGYKIDIGSSVHLMIHHTPIIKDLRLADFGLEYIEMDPWASFPLENGKTLSFYRDLGRTCESIRQVSISDAAAYERFIHSWGPVTEGVFKVFQEPPTLAAFGRHVILAKSPGEGTIDGLKQIMMGYGRLLRETFESSEMRAALGWLAAQSGPPPSEPGGGPFAGWHAAVHKFGAKRARGGSGMLSVALGRAIEASGGEIVTDAPVERIIVEQNGKASGIILQSGEVIYAKKIVSACHIVTTFKTLLLEADLTPEMGRQISALNIGNGFGMTVRCAADALPDYGGGTPAEMHNGMQLLCPTLDYLVQAHGDYAGGTPSKQPAVLAMTFSAIDPTLAPPGKHVVQLWSQYFPYQRSDGRFWDDAAREEAAESILQTLYKYAPNMRKAITAKHIQSPLDLERTLGLLHGNVMHLEMSLDQMFAMRPLPDLANYRSPIGGLYLTGASMHPGGGVFGASGRSTARVMIGDGRG